MSCDITSRFAACWQRSDEIFALLPDEALLEQPIALRHPLLFYLGHLPAFAWNQVCRAYLGKPSFNPHFDALFERGIDPVGVDSYEAGVEWPPVQDVLAYRDQVRAALVECADEVLEAGEDSGAERADDIVSLAIEHELMHQETLQYLLQQLPPGTIGRPAGATVITNGAAHAREVVPVAGGPVLLGAARDRSSFGWDNEFPELEMRVDAFEVDRLPVTNGELLEFLDSGGYDRRELWLPDDWEWRLRTGLEHPGSWQRQNGRHVVRTVFGPVELADAASWPVYLSLAEARAFCSWRGRRLLSEAEYHRAAFWTPDDELRAFPWGEASPTAERGNFDFNQWCPVPVGSHPAGDSAWGVGELVGNGWEWTSTPFGPFPGFEVIHPSYPGYSADFFDDQHFVMLGASWATPRQLLRRSFRNWFQDRYPYVFATFRTVADSGR